ncbi:MAG: SGNH/GDSL hydrolase family protein [Chthoniobacteraceae bacterium]
MKHFLLRSLSAGLLPLLVLATTQSLRADDEALPTTVFKNLQAGKKQTVVVYGTSLTILGAWAKGVNDYFNQQYPGLVTFFNGAKAGMASDWGVANLQDRVLSKNPDLVFIEFSMNDAATNRNVSLEQSAANLDQMVKSIRQQNPQADIILQTMDIAWDSPKTPTKKYGSERPNLNGYYDVYRHYAQEHHLALVDNYPNWLKLKTGNEANYEKMVGDGIHPHSGPSMAVTFPAVKALLEKARTAAAAAK